MNKIEQPASADSSATRSFGSGLSGASKADSYGPKRLPTRFYLGLGGVAQLIVLGVTRPSAVASRPTLAAGIATALAAISFVVSGLLAQWPASGPAKVVWSLFGSFWAGFGFWVVSVPFSLAFPLPVQSAAPPIAGFVYPFPFTYHDFDVSRDLASVMMLSAVSGLGAGGLGLATEKIGRKDVTKGAFEENEDEKRDFLTDGKEPPLVE